MEKLIYTRFKLFASTNINDLTPCDMLWKPLYRNNEPNRENLIGFYSLVISKDRYGILFGKKYTVMFQHKEKELATGVEDRGTIDRYILFEKQYDVIEGPLEYVQNDHGDNETENTLSQDDLFNYGNFIYAYESFHSARLRSLSEYKNWIANLK